MFGWASFGRIKFREETYDHDLKVDERGNATRWEHEHAEHELSEDDLLS
ncbi:hypothetical protein HYS54_01225, partial [Candidatus Micrarchaeota archaeon]|nr:hypothetical protein [Candidatus Micrarchaeota archaeon]